MSILNVEPLIQGELFATKLWVKLPDSEGKYTENNLVKILLNCGWSLDFDEEKLEQYRKKVEDVDVILITDGDFSHSGALLWLLSRFLSENPESCPKVLCTEGTYKFIRASLIDVLENAAFTSNFNYYTAEDLDYFNENCVKLRFRETYCYWKKLEDIEIKTSFTAVNNGYSVGGALWLVSVGFNTIVCGDKIRIYPSTLLNGIDINDIRRADLIMLSHEEVDEEKHVEEEQEVEICNDFGNLVEKLVKTLNNGGNVLFPMDIEYSLINLLINLNMIWETSQLSQFKIVLASPIADKLLLFIGTCLEYMKTTIFHNFIKTLWNPLMDLRNIEIITSLTQLAKYRFRPTVFISTTSNVEFGFSNFLFLAISSYYKNLVVLNKPNKSVCKYVYGQKAFESQTPQYKLQINLNYNKYQKQEEQDEKDKETEYYQKYSNLETHTQFQNIQSAQGEVEEKNTQDYGMPFTEFLGDPNNPYGFTNMQNYEEEYEEEEEYGEQEENSKVDEYYRMYIDETKKNLFDIETESAQEVQPKSDLLTKKFPFVVRSEICLAKCLSNVVHEPQMPSLLYRTEPRNVLLIPNTTNFVKSEMYLSKLLKCNLHTFHKNQEFKVKTQSKREKNMENINPVVSIEMDLNNYPVLIHLPLLTSVRNYFNKKEPREISKKVNSKYEGIEKTINSIQRWKYQNNREKTCQMISKLRAVEDEEQNKTKNRIINCSTFWSEETSKKSKYEFTLEGMESVKREDQGKKVKMGVESTLLVGEVSMANYTKFVDECLPNAVNIVSGKTIIKNKVKVYKQSEGRNKEWVIEGTLDPSYYLARKLIRKLHNEIEPIY